MTSQQKPQTSTLSIVLAVGVCLLILVVFWLLIWITALNSQVQDLKKEVDSPFNVTQSDIDDIQSAVTNVNDRVDDIDSRVSDIELDR